MSEQNDIAKEDTPKEEIDYDQRSVALRTTQSICFVQEHDKASMLELILKDYKYCLLNDNKNFWVPYKFLYKFPHQKLLNLYQYH